MERVFLGDKAPLSKLVSEYIINNYTKDNVLDLKNVSFVVSGASIHRRIIEQILKDTEKENIFFIPPQTHTIKSIIDKITTTDDKTLINDFLCELILIKALKNRKNLVNEAFFKGTDFDEKDSSYINLAKKILSLYLEIGRANLSFNDIKDKIKKLDLYDDSKRWKVLSDIYDEYKNLLLENNFVDSFIQRKDFIKNNKGECFVSEDGREQELIFINTPDLSPIFCDIIRKIKSKITFLIYDNKENEDCFTDVGSLNIGKFLNKKIKINDDDIKIAKDPRYAGNIVENEIVKLSKDYSATDIVICTTDDALILPIKNECEKRNIKISALRENRVSNTFLYDIFEKLRDYVQNPTFLNFKKFICQSDILNFIVSKIKNDEGESIDQKDILDAFDCYEEEHFPFYLTKVLHTNAQDEVILSSFNLVKEFLGDTETKESLKFFTKKALDLILKIFEDKKLSYEKEEDKYFIQVFETYKNTLFKVSNIDENIFDLKLSYDDFILILNELCANVSVTPRPEDDTVEIQGWLEVQSDNSKALILTGLYEGSWPQNIVSHEFLPNSLRTILGLDDNDKRFARDAFILQSLLNSKEKIIFVPLRQNADLSTNLLSKLMLLGDEKENAKRVLEFYDSPLKEFDLSINSKLEDFSFYNPPKIKSYEKNIFSPSELKTYNISPYGYYLQYVLNLSSVETNQKEFSAVTFGNVIHEILKEFGVSKIKDSMDDSEIKKFLFKRLEEYIKNDLGKEYFPAINVQLEKIKDILEVFSLWQAKRRQEGWEILYVEKPFKDVVLNIDSKGNDASNKVLIKGRFDRVDYHRQKDKYEIIDYKTGSNEYDIKKVYGPKKGWEDWQMPFYKYALSLNVSSDKILTSYLNLSMTQDISKYKCDVEIGEQMLSDALESASEIIKNIQNARFDEPGKIELLDDAFLDLI